MTKTPKVPTGKTEQLKLSPKEPTLLYAIQDLIRTGGMDFDEWWDSFKKGFLARKTTKHSNYPVKDWVKPKYEILVPLDENNKSGVREIEYFPDENDLQTSYLIRGNDHDLIFHITAIEYQTTGSGENKVNGKNSNSTLKGFPALELEFKSENGKRAEKLIRCPGYTDNPDVAQMELAKLIKPTNIMEWARKIKTIFGDSNYSWRKGNNCVSYMGHIARLQGLSGHAFVRTEADGIALFTALLKIHDMIPDKGGFNYSEKTDKSKFNIERTIEVLNESIKLDKEREIADYYFFQAKLRLPLIKKPILLVRKNVIVYKP